MNKGPLDDNSIKDITRLHDAITDLEGEQNTTDIFEFGEFLPLFQKDSGIDNEQIEDLSTQFIRRFNPYSKIEITDISGDVLVTLPQLFTPVKPIDKQFINTVDKFHKDGGSEVPKYSSEAISGLVTAIEASHTDQEYAKEIVKIAASHQQMLADFDKTKDADSAPVLESTSDKSVNSETYDPSNDPDLDFD